MENEIEALINSIKNKDNPTKISDNISDFIFESLRGDKISLYEAYLMNMEAIKFMRLGYIQPAWNGRVRIIPCLTLLNQKLLANVFNENESAVKIKELALEAYKLNKEKRPHYIMNKYNEFLEANTDVSLLKEMLSVRKNYDKLSFDEGPYHNDVFPYDFYSPEEILLNEEKRKEYLNNKNIQDDIDEFFIQLFILGV